MTSEKFPARDKDIEQAGMFSSLQNLGHQNCQAKLEAGKVHQVGPTQQHRNREGKETNNIIWTVPENKVSSKTDKAIFCR